MILLLVVVVLLLLLLLYPIYSVLLFPESSVVRRPVLCNDISVILICIIAYMANHG